MRKPEDFRDFLQAVEDMDVNFLAVPYGNRETMIDVTEIIKEALVMASGGENETEGVPGPGSPISRIV